MDMLQKIQCDAGARAKRRSPLTDHCLLITNFPSLPHNLLCLACLAMILPVLTGCGLLRISPSQPKAEIKQVHVPTNEVGGVITLNMLEAQVMRFADVYASTVAQAADDLSARVGTPEARLAGLRWKLGQGTSAYVVATGSNPSLNALDTLVLVTLARMVVEDHQVKVFGEAALPLLETHRKLEADAWLLANGALKPPQQQELRELIQEWREKNPDQRYIGAIRFKEFVTALGRMPRLGTTAPTSVLSLLFLDPLADLDPTTAAIEDTRLLGERAMYYTQRMPTLLAWQTELLAYQLAVQPESKQMLADAERLAGAAEVFSRTAGQLPQVVNDQREAAIKQLLDGLMSEEGKTRALLAETRQTLAAGNEMATSINSTVRSLNELVRSASPPVTNQTSVATNSKPFDVLDYGRAAGQIGAAANDLSALLVAVNQSTPAVQHLSQQTTADAQRVLQQAFRLALVLICVFLAGSVGAGLAYRALANKLDARRRQMVRSGGERRN